MESVFYKYGFNKRFPVTYLFLELFSKSIENSSDDVTIEDAITPVLSRLGYAPPYSEEMILGIAEDMHDIQKAKEKNDEKKTSQSGKSKKRSFGTEFAKWFSKLEIDQILFVLTDYDFERSCTMYSEVPVMVVDRMIETRVGYEWTGAEKDFEAVLLGMGGEFKGGGTPADNEHEAPKTEREKEARDASLKKLGFM